MKFLNLFKKSNLYITLISLISLTLIYPIYIYAEPMQSTTYKINSDSINFGGGNSSSNNYNIGDTIGEVGTGDSTSTNYALHAGFRQMQESSIAISSPTDLVMASMGGLSGGSSEGVMSWVITTDNNAGYTMSIASTTTPALKSINDSLADYVPAGADPDYNFNNLPANSSFGFSPEGTETNTQYKDNGSICNTGTLETIGKCWDGLSTTPKIIAGSTTSNMPTGSTATVRFRAESGANHIQTSGQYNVTIIATATTL